MRRLVPSVAALLAVLALTSAAGAGAAPLRVTITEVGGASFPDRAFVLTLPRPVPLGAAAVEVTENGSSVHALRLASSSGREGRNLGVVLVVDASDSMRGAPIDNALQAARSFAAQQAPLQRLGVLAFNRRVQALAPLTTRSRAVAAALGTRPRLAYGTHIFDATSAAIASLARAHLAGGAVVLLSDGADTGSAHSLAQVVAQARAAHVRIFAVGLRSKAFDPRALRTLADGAGGAYVEAASAASLAPIFQQLGAQLAHQYVLRYRSLSNPGTRVRVRIVIPELGAAGETAYVTPKVGHHASGVFHQPFADVLWGSPVTMVLVVLVVAALAAFALVVTLRTRPTHVRARIGEFVSIAGADTSAPAAAPPPPSRPLDRAARSLSRLAWWQALTEELQLAQISVEPIVLAAGTLLVTLFATWLLALLSPIAALLGLGVPFAVVAAIRSRAGKVRSAFEEQLPDNLSVLASAMRAGHSFVGALSVVADDAPEPSRSEFVRVIGDERLGVPLEDALGVVVRRMRSVDLEQVSLVAALQRDAGGNMAEILGGVADAVRERAELRRLVKSLTANGRFSAIIVTALPIVLLIAVSVISPGYASPLFHDPLGRTLLAIGAVSLTAGAIVSRRIARIDV
jgi:tight adherence protein B